MTDDDEHKVSFLRGGKYRNSAKTLLPYRRSKSVGHPADNAGFFSTVFFSWLTKLIWKLYRSPISVGDLWKAPDGDKAVPNARRLLRLWQEEVNSKKDKASMRKVVLRFLRTRLILGGVAIAPFVLCQFASNGIIVLTLLKYVEESSSNLATGLYLIAGMAASECIRALSFSIAFAISLRSGIRLRSGATTAVFQKMMRVPPTETSSVGEIVNICSADGDRLFDATYLSHLLLTSPLMFFLSTAYICFLLGPVGLLGCALFIIVLGIQVALLKFLNKIRRKALVFTDKRIQFINEVLSSIKLIKMYAWEENFIKVICNIRSKENALLTRAMFFQSFNMSLAWLSPYLATILVLFGAVSLGINVTTSEAFTCFALFHSMSFSLKVIPIALKNLADAGVAADRLQKVLERKEYIDYRKSSLSSGNLCIELCKATLQWPKQDGSKKKEKSDNAGDDDSSIDKQDAKILQDSDGQCDTDGICLKAINLAVENGTLVGICGKVGCGKSSLVSAMLGHMELCSGTVAICGTTAYCPQQAWIMNATLRDNITFGLPYEKEKYDQIVEACCLLPDFEILPSGDLTEVGEKGVNMSGGQKQRINIARAIYMDRDIYLLDDPLSAVDAHVGKAMFENAFLKLLKKKNKTLILVTHRLEYLPYCDQVVVLKDGMIREIGTHDDLMEYGDDYYHLYKLWIKEKQNEENVESSTRKEEYESNGHRSKDAEANEASKLARGRLMTKEEKAFGSIRLATYALYIKSAGGWFAAVACLITFILYICCLQFNSFWLSYWLNQGSGLENNTDFTSDSSWREETVNNSFSNSSFTFTSPSEVVTLPVSDKIIDNPRLYFYITIFGYAVAATLVTMTIKALVFSWLSLRAANRLHKKLLGTVMRGKMEFFDTTPSGRILNRFQKDQDVLDNIIPLLLDLIISIGFIILSCLALIAFVFPYFLLSLVVLIPIFLVAFFLFKGAVTEMRRQDNITRSPWLSHITTSLTGIHTILAYNRSEDFIERFQSLLDINTVPFFLFTCINRWLVTRLDFISITMTILCAVLAVFTTGLLPPSYAALALSSALMLTVMFQFTVRTAVETEANFVCAERFSHYLKSIPLEKQDCCKENLAANWPQFGSIRFTDVQMRYRDQQPLVLKGISFNVDTKDKIGIVGRTGSGKSSLGVALFRLVDLCGGKIEIDGINTTDISLHQLRSKISIIPQEPVLFTGTIKYNVDPFQQYTDQDIWLALERTHMKEAISILPQQLEAQVSENGLNFSVGERQLLCLTRALLRKNKILLLDEATASIDARTDKLVQETIVEHFGECTILTIAHRLHTVMSCDKIMVLERGNLIEFDTPSNLSRNPDSHFAKLLKSTEF